MIKEFKKAVSNKSSKNSKYNNHHMTLKKMKTIFKYQIHHFLKQKKLTKIQIPLNPLQDAQGKKIPHNNWIAIKNLLDMKSIMIKPS
jgi:hypothetical protein